MTVKVSHLIGAAVAIAALLGAAFAFGMKWSGTDTHAEAAAASTAAAATSSDAVEEEGDATSRGSERRTYAVTKVIDGDTIAISKDGKTETVRLIGIDTPETVDTRVEVQCFGKEASETMKSLLTGRDVYLEIDAGEGERDKYKRMLAYVFRDDGLFTNRYMIEEGYAYEYTYDSAYKYQKEFKAAEASAKAAQKGLWKPDACPKPEVKGAAAAPKAEPTPTPEAATQVAAPKPEETRQEEPEPEPEEEPEPAPSGNYTCSSNKYNCTDFSTHAEAQAVFDMCGGADNDVHKLDNNKDGEACESLP